MTTALDDAYAISKSRKNAGYSPTEAAEYIGSGREVISAYECGHRLLENLNHRSELEDLYEVTLPLVDDAQTFSAPLNIDEVIPRARDILKHSVTQAGNAMGVDQVAVRDWQRGNKMASSSILLVTWYFLQAEKASAAAGVNVKFTPESINQAKANKQPFFDGTDLVEWAKAVQMARKPKVSMAIRADTTHPQQMRRVKTKKVKSNPSKLTPTPTQVVLPIDTEQTATVTTADSRRLAFIATVMTSSDAHIKAMADHAYKLHYEGNS